MHRSFQLIGIDHDPFLPLFALSDDALEAHAAKRFFATESPGFPCRVSLQDARVGEELLLLPYLHQPSHSPYRASGPIFVRRGVRRARLPIGDMPPYVTRRQISVRAYDAQHMMVAASVREGTAAAAEIDAYFGRDDVAYVHLHNAGRGCFSCRVVRVAEGDV